MTTTAVTVQHDLDAVDLETLAHVHEALLQAPPLGGGPEGRAGFDAMLAAVTPAAGVTFEPATVAGVPGWWCRPEDPQPGAVLYLHGGAFVVGSAWAYRPFVSHVAAATRTAVFVCDYALAPEQPFPCGFDEVVTVWRELARTTERIALVGDSAGAGLAIALASHIAHDPDLIAGRQPRAIALFSPWTDLTLSGATMTTRAEHDLMLTATMLTTAAASYAGPRTGDPRVSPLFGRLDSLPPMVVHVGEDEILLDDSLRLAERINAEGGTVTTHVWAGMQHVFPNVRELAAARLSVELVGDAVSELMAR